MHLAIDELEARRRVEEVDHLGRAMAGNPDRHRRLRTRVDHHDDGLAARSAKERDVLRSHAELLVFPSKQRLGAPPDRDEALERVPEVLPVSVSLHRDEIQIRTQRAIVGRRPRARDAPLATRVHRGHPRDREQERVEGKQVRAVTHRACYSVDIVIVGEVVER
jgi:hypothetical protein